MAVKTIKDQELEPLRELARAHQAALEQAERTRSALDAEKDRLLAVWQPKLDVLTEDDQETPEGEHLQDLVSELDSAFLDDVPEASSMDDLLKLRGV